MKNLISILLSIVIFCQGAGLEMNDIFLLGRFIEHAEYHSENYGDDFFTFFKKHYGYLIDQYNELEKENKHEHDHGDLPFQHNGCNHSIAEVIVLGYEFPLKKMEVSIRSDQGFFYKNLYSSLEKISIFQPPKIA